MKIVLLIDQETLPDHDPELEGKTPDICRQAEFHVAETLRHEGHDVVVVPLVPDAFAMVERLKNTGCDAVFNLTEHWGGDRRKDFHVAALLELLGIPFTGSGPQALMLCRDKGLSKQVLQHHGLRVPRFITLDVGKTRSRRKLHFPVIVKPTLEDGSEGISQASLVRSQEELEARVTQMHSLLKQPVICEEFIEGRELYVGIIGNTRLQALPARELVFDPAKDGGPTFATAKVKQDEDYREKWGVEYTNGDLDSRLQNKVAAFCKKVYRLLGIRDYGRIDLRVDPAGHIYFLEANANPDITMGDEVSEAWEKTGRDYSSMVTTILNLAMTRKKH